MKTWIWPFNWYHRIRDLESQLAILNTENQYLDAHLRTMVLTQTGITTAYAAAMSSLMNRRPDWWYSAERFRLDSQRNQEMAAAEYQRFKQKLEAEQSEKRC